MSIEYDEYLSEHIENVQRGLNWMRDNLKVSGLIDERAMDIACENALIHDSTKVASEEYPAYDAYFYGGNRSSKVCQDFNYAWLHHQKLNKHHWQYWILIKDEPDNIDDPFDTEFPKTGPTLKPMLIPLEYVYEMIADWWTFSWKNENLFEIFKWYNLNSPYMLMHDKTRAVVNCILQEMYKILIMQETIAGHDITDIEKQYMLYFMHKPEPVVEHSGIKGQKWGIRRFQNYDGSLTEAGKIRYGRKLVKENKAHDAAFRQKILNDSEATKNVMKKAKALENELNEEYRKWINDETAVKKDMATYYKKRGWPKEDIDKDYSEMGIDLHDSVWCEHVRKDPQLSNKQDKIYDLMQDYRKEAEKIYRSLLEAYGDIDVNWIPSKERDGSMLQVLTSKAGYDDFYNILYQEDKDELTPTLKHSDVEEDKHKYGVPELKKFPMPDKDHVKSAIRFFNYIDPKHEKELAYAILKRMEEYGMAFEDFGVGDENRFKKYIPKEEKKG